MWLLKTVRWHMGLGCCEGGLGGWVRVVWAGIGSGSSGVAERHSTSRAGHVLDQMWGGQELMPGII